MSDEFDVLTGDKAHDFIKSIMPPESELEKESIETIEKYNELTKNDKFHWDEKWGEISGFKKYGLSMEGYEWCCRFMFIKGLEWIHENPEAKIKQHGIERTYGISFASNIDTEQLRKQLIWAAKQLGSAPSGAQMHAVIDSLRFIVENGFDKWEEEMIKRG